MSGARKWWLAAAVAGALGACGPAWSAGRAGVAGEAGAPGGPGGEPAAGAGGGAAGRAPGEPWRAPEPDLGYVERQGRALFEYWCAYCHGERGRGDGFNAYSLDPGPRDLSSPAFQDGRTDEEIADVIRIGGGAAGMSNAMPPWGRVLNDRQVRQLVAYIRTLRRAEESE